MKTTIDLPDDLLERARHVARQEGTTLRAVFEEGLHLALRTRQLRRRGEPFRIRPFAGNGLTPEFESAGWASIRDEIYRDRG